MSLLSSNSSHLSELLFLCPLCKLKLPKIQQIFKDISDTFYIILKCSCTPRSQIISLNSFIQDLSKINKNNSCSFHESAQASKFCSSCEKFLCENCIYKHTICFPQHNSGYILDKCKIHSNNLIWFYCTQCNTELCKECFENENFEHKNHKVSFINTYHKAQLDKLKYKSFLDFEAAYNKLSSSLNAQIEKINELIIHLNHVKEQLLEHYNVLTVKNKNLLKLTSILYFNFFQNINFTAIQNMVNIKQNFDLFEQDIAHISTYISNINQHFQTMKSPSTSIKHLSSHAFIYKVNDHFYNNRIISFPTNINIFPNNYIVYQRSNITQNFTQFLENKSFTPFIQSIEQVKDSLFIYVEQNKFTIYNIFTNKTYQTEENPAIVQKFKTLNLSSPNQIAMYCYHDFFILDIKTMKFIKHVNMKNMHYANNNNIYVIKAVEITCEIIALLTSDFTVRLLCLNTNAPPYVISVLDENSYDMVKLSNGNIAVTSNDKIKIINPYRKEVEMQWRNLSSNPNNNIIINNNNMLRYGQNNLDMEEPQNIQINGNHNNINNIILGGLGQNGNNNVGYKLYIQFLYALENNILVVSDGNSTSFWDVNNIKRIDHLSDVKTRKVIEKEEYKILIFNGCDIAKIYDYEVFQVELIINLEGNIITWFKLWDGRIGYAGTKGIKILK